MVDRTSDLSLSRQCRLLQIGRTSLYYTPYISEAKLELMAHIDELYTEDPTRGTRRMCGALKKRGIHIGRGKARKIMRMLGIAAIYRKPNLSKPAPGHKIYPYLLRNVAITRAISKYGCPEVFNTDQGSQFTSEEFTGILENHGIKISMDGRGRALDNVFVERLWRTVKHEGVYIKDYQSIQQCRLGLQQFFERYNYRREHQSLDYNYPSEVYFGQVDLSIAA